MKLCHPLKGDFYISQRFGERPEIYTTSGGHNGVDFAIYKLPCYAMRKGVVIVSSEYSHSGADGKVGYGRHVRVRHDNGISIYGHLSRRDVKEGDMVEEGQQIGITGGETSDPNSGYSTGAHLHAEYRLDNIANLVPGGYVYNAIDILPLLYIPPYMEETMLFYGKVIVDDLNVRNGASKTARWLGTASKEHDPYPIYEVSGDWLRFGDGMWFCEKEKEVYVQRIAIGQTNQPEPTQAEKVDKLWEVVRSVHPDKF